VSSRRRPFRRPNWLTPFRRPSTGGRSAAVNSTDRACKPGWTRLRANSEAFWSRVAPARIPTQPPFASTSWRSTRRCGCSRRSKGRADEQSCSTSPALGRAVAEELLRLPQRGGVPVRGADADRGPDPAAAETSGAGLPVSRDHGSPGRPSRSTITGRSAALNSYWFFL
jgi:hypothetical protein